MNEIEKAIEYFSGYGSPHDRLIVQALKEKAERDKMRCENCRYWGEYSRKCMSNGSSASMVTRIETDFCDWFKPKENENNER